MLALRNVLPSAWSPGMAGDAFAVVQNFNGGHRQAYRFQVNLPGHGLKIADGDGGRLPAGSQA